MDEIQGLIDAHEQFKGTLAEADKESRSIVSLVTEVKTIATQYQIPGGIENPYTTLTETVCLTFAYHFSLCFLPAFFQHS